MGGPGSGRKHGSKGKKWVGAPTKLTEELFRDIVKLVEVGNYFETACHAVGIPADTGRKWLRQGANAKDADGMHARFVVAYKRAEARAQASAVVRIRQHANKAWQADAWYLERKFPRQWGRGQWREGPEQQVSSTPAVNIYLPSNGRDDDAPAGDDTTSGDE